MSSTTLPSSHNCLEGMAGLNFLVLCPSHRRLRWKAHVINNIVWHGSVSRGATWCHTFLFKFMEMYIRKWNSKVGRHSTRSCLSLLAEQQHTPNTCTGNDAVCSGTHIQSANTLWNCNCKGGATWSPILRAATNVICRPPADFVT